MNKIQNWAKAKFIVEDWQKAGDKVVFTNGCFDILHAGHVTYLAQAKQLGQRLVLGLNSDNSVQGMQKSPNRPLQNQMSRSLVMAALEAVDLVVIFDQDTPLELIKTLKPNILVKGSDYQIGDIVGGPEVISWGGQVKTIDFVPGYSTTAIEQKILAGKN
jgi:D-beta-D-heptose 7-phosphate kinase/D-beta-D-heptose 1-phosphate adenosyltransferase